MKQLFRGLFLLMAFFVLSSGVIAAQTPVPPVLFQGEVAIDGVMAPIGTIVVAEVEGEEVATNKPDGIKEIGKYVLVVPNEGYVGKMVEFKVNGIVAAEREYAGSMDTPVVELDLDVKTGSSGTSGKTGDGLSGLFGLSPVAIAGIAAGALKVPF